ncbi:MAG: hypothetical protein GC192_16205 [Bacteroidetes bacterium]|nr:hypothetical protein [Bacteroidota bacterium]
MRGGTLYKTLSLLEIEQMPRLLRFVSSPYFNSEVEKAESPTVILCNYLIERLPIDEDELIDENDLFEQLFPSKKFVQGKVDKVMSALLKLVRLFIIYENSEFNEEINQSLILAKFFRMKDWDEKFSSEIIKIKGILKNAVLKDENLYFQTLAAEQEIHAFENRKNYRKGDVNLSTLLISLDQFYLYNKYKYSMLLIQQQRFVEVKLDEGILKTNYIREGVSKNIFEKNLTLNIYELMLQLLNGESENLLFLFNKVQLFIEANIHLLTLQEVKDMQAYLRNFCTAQHNLGDINFLDRLFQLYQHNLENGYIHDDGKINASTFVNIVSVGLRLKKYEWVKGFLDKNKGKIYGTHYTEEVYNLNAANYFFHVKDYEQSWVLLDWTFEDIYLKLASKRLEVKILFEQNLLDMLDSKVNALKVYLSRTDKMVISTTIKKMNTAFLNYLSQILNPNTLHNRMRILKIKEKILAQKAVAEREWLLEKVEELLQK